MTKIKYTHKEITPFAHAYYKMLQLPGQKKVLLQKLETGIDQSKLGTNFKIDPSKDEHAKEVLTNWKNLSKDERLDFCQWLVDDSISAITWAQERKEELKEKIKSKADIRRFWRGK